MTNTPIENIEKAIDDSGAQVTACVEIKLLRGNTLTWEETEVIRENGYKIIDVTYPRKGDDERVVVRCIRDKQTKELFGVNVELSNKSFTEAYNDIPSGLLKIEDADGDKLDAIRHYMSNAGSTSDDAE